MDKTSAPKVHSACPEFTAQFNTAYVDFVDGCREALKGLHGEVLEPLFPEGSLPPGYRFQVG